MHFGLAAALGVFLAMGTVPAGADMDAMIEDCDGCHGKDGVSEWDDMPTIAGIDAYTHEAALFDYIDERRPCAESEYRIGDTDRPPTTMCKVVEAMTEDEIIEIADYYAQLEFVPAKQAFDPALAAQGEKIQDGTCEKCHAAGGTDVEDEASILGGQWMGYLELQLQQYRSGEREKSEDGIEQIEELSNADVTALVHYYASQQ